MIIVRVIMGMIMSWHFRPHWNGGSGNELWHGLPEVKSKSMRRGEHMQLAVLLELGGARE
jgi:hypothetical protein